MFKSVVALSAAAILGANAAPGCPSGYDVINGDCAPGANFNVDPFFLEWSKER